MTHYYHYIEADSSLNENTVFYMVGVGTSRQATRDYLFLIAHAAEHNHYFEIFSSQSAEFVRKCKKSLAPTIPTSVKISARDLVRMFKNKERPAVNTPATPAQHFALMQLDSNYRLFCNLTKRNLSHPERTHVKNLSNETDTFMDT